MNPRSARSRILAVLVTALALLQAMVPLLHAHVRATRDMEYGVHFHVPQAALEADRDTLAATAISESTAITAATEFRRDEPRLDHLLLSAPASSPSAAVEFERLLAWQPRGIFAPPGAQALLPPADAPPPCLDARRVMVAALPITL